MQCPELHLSVPRDVDGAASVEGAFPSVLITEYQAPGVVTQCNETKITIFSQASCSLLT